MSDDILRECSETELIQIAKKQGLPILKRGLPLEEYVAIVSGQKDPTPDQLADVNYTRRILQDYLAKNWNQVVSQLPGCDGKCTTYPCSNGRHIKCFTPSSDLVRR